jgi:endoglucanase
MIGACRFAAGARRRSVAEVRVKPGINLGGGEFAHLNLPGTLGQHYTYPTTTWNNIDTGDESGFAYWYSKGMRVVRMPFKWDRVQRTLGGELYETDMAYLDNAVAQTDTLGMWLILDVHNAAYYGVNWDKIGDGVVTQEHFNDLWTRLANRYKAYPHVMFGLMNEPDNTWTATDWRDVALSCVAAIRATGATNTIVIQGVWWSGAYSWVSDWAGGTGGNGAAWAGQLPPNCLLEMHHYLDTPVSGEYSSAPYCATGSGTWLQWATAWLRTNGYRALLGEFGYPDDSGGLNTCPPEASSVFDHLEANADVWWGFTMWSGGPWVRTGGDPATMSLEPENGDRPQITAAMARAWDLSNAP